MPSPRRWPTVKWMIPSWRPSTRPSRSTISPGPAAPGRSRSRKSASGPVARHKADIRTVLLIGHREPEAARQFTRLELGAVTEREPQQVELGGCRCEQEITLVALGFARPIERASAIRQPPRGDIVTGGQHRRAELARSRQQIVEFDRLVALDTRHRRLSGDIAFSEAIDDHLL